MAQKGKSGCLEEEYLCNRGSAELGLPIGWSWCLFLSQCDVTRVCHVDIIEPYIYSTAEDRIEYTEDRVEYAEFIEKYK